MVNKTGLLTPVLMEDSFGLWKLCTIKLMQISAPTHLAKIKIKYMYTPRIDNYYDLGARGLPLEPSVMSTPSQITTTFSRTTPKIHLPWSNSHVLSVSKIWSKTTTYDLPANLVPRVGQTRRKRTKFHSEVKPPNSIS